MIAMKAKKSGMIILGGGVIKHHICNANLMRNGADYSVFINTGQEFDGSDSGAKPEEAKSWGKIKVSFLFSLTFSCLSAPFIYCFEPTDIVFRLVTVDC